MNKENFAVTLKLLASLDQELSMAIKEGLTASALLVPPRAHSLEMFLCVLYSRYPDTILPYFNDPTAFKFLKDALLPTQVPADLTGLPDFVDESDRGPNTASGYHIEIDENLSRILINAARISFALFHRRTSVPDLVASIAVEPQICESLALSWGISLKGLKT